jgi:hypothetical protein
MMRDYLVQKTAARRDDGEWADVFYNTFGDVAVAIGEARCALRQVFGPRACLSLRIEARRGGYDRAGVLTILTTARNGDGQPATITREFYVGRMCGNPCGVFSTEPDASADKGADFLKDLCRDIADAFLHDPSFRPAAAGAGVSWSR